MLCMFQFFYVLTVILLGEMVLTTAVFIIYFVPEARDNFLRSQPEKILSSALYRYMDDAEVKQWVDKIQSEVRVLLWRYNSDLNRDSVA